jgi:NADPH:quinone reductase-like Zn-dependent oxidoreductase
VAKPDVLAELLALAADERLVPVIEHTWPLAEAGDALAHVDGRHAVGKTVVTIA